MYHHVDGGILGYWRVGKRGEFWLDKANRAFESVRLDASRNWTLWGTGTRIVDTVGTRASHRPLIAWHSAVQSDPPRG